MTGESLFSLFLYFLSLSLSLFLSPSPSFFSLLQRKMLVKWWWVPGTLFQCNVTCRSGRTFKFLTFESLDLKVIKMYLPLLTERKKVFLQSECRHHHHLSMFRLLLSLFLSFLLALFQSASFTSFSPSVSLPLIYSSLNETRVNFSKSLLPPHSVCRWISSLLPRKVDWYESLFAFSPLHSRTPNWPRERLFTIGPEREEKSPMKKSVSQSVRLANWLTWPEWARLSGWITGLGSGMNGEEDFNSRERAKERTQRDWTTFRGWATADSISYHVSRRVLSLLSHRTTKHPCPSFLFLFFLSFAVSLFSLSLSLFLSFSHPPCHQACTHHRSSSPHVFLLLWTEVNVHFTNHNLCLLLYIRVLLLILCLLDFDGCLTFHWVTKKVHNTHRGSLYACLQVWQLFFLMSLSLFFSLSPFVSQKIHRKTNYAFLFSLSLPLSFPFPPPPPETYSFTH